MTQEAKVVERIVDQQVELEALVKRLNSSPARIKLTRGHVEAIARAEREERLAKRGRRTA